MPVMRHSSTVRRLVPKRSARVSGWIRESSSGVVTIEGDDIREVLTEGATALLPFVRAVIPHDMDEFSASSGSALNTVAGSVTTPAALIEVETGW